MTKSLKGKKVLMLGLGALGGGVATVNWLLDQGAAVLVSDLKDEKALAGSVKRIEEHLKKVARDGKDYEKRKNNLAWALGGHSNAMVDASDVVVVNPDVSVHNPYVQRALEKKIAVANEGTLFYDYFKGKTIGITGTRGKTTTANWTHHFIKGSVLTGNSVTKPFQSVIDDRAKVAVTELSSFILELFRGAPKVAVITNLYQDHLNRHGTMEGYARAKANIFAHQTSKDVLILNKDDAWTPWFLEQKPKAKVLYFSTNEIPKELNVDGFAAQWGKHNLANLLAAAAAARAVGVPWAQINSAIPTLPQVPYRQEAVFSSRALTVINDTTATSPEGALAALKRFGGPNCILITGGTDRELDYRSWAKALPEHITATNTIFLAGSATQKMKQSLERAAMKGVRTYDSLQEAWRAALKRSKLFVSATILFSPGAKSFELFKNEFDRGEQFNALVKRDLK